MTFENIFKYYSNGLWSKNLVKIAVLKGIITKDEYEKITNEKYC